MIERITRGTFAGKVVRIKRSVVWHPGQPSYLIKNGRNNHIPLVAPGVQGTEHQTKALDVWKQTRGVGDHELRVETELQEWLQPFTEGWWEPSWIETINTIMAVRIMVSDAKLTMAKSLAIFCEGDIRKTYGTHQSTTIGGDNDNDTDTH